MLLMVTVVTTALSAGISTNITPTANAAATTFLRRTARIWGLLGIGKEDRNANGGEYTRKSAILTRSKDGNHGINPHCDFYGHPVPESVPAVVGAADRVGREHHA